MEKARDSNASSPAGSGVPDSGLLQGVDASHPGLDFGLDRQSGKPECLLRGFDFRFHRLLLYGL